jgi:diguanylate cyclase (GGDEF)-like protein
LPGSVALLQRALSIHRSFLLRYRLRHSSGEWRWIESHGQGVFDQNGVLKFIEGALFDVTDRTRTEAELEHQALHDTLTDLPNRALFHDRVHTSIQRLRRDPDDLFAVVLVDMDRFKVINDSLGPGIADRLLKAIGQRLAASVDAGDTVARLGGDEFGLLLDVLEDPNDAIRVVERLHRTLGSPFQIASNEIYCTASIGITLSHPRYESAEEMLRDADTAMYRAKAKGPGQHVIFDPRMHERALERLALESQLRRAFERDELLVWYQPIRDLASGSVVAVEALVRWSHPERGLVSPDSFLEIARDAGLMQLVAVAVLRPASPPIAGLRRHHPNLCVNVNLDASDIAWPNLVPEIGRILAASGLPPAALTLEITEHAVMRQSEATERVLHQLRRLGVGISIDDFGTGYSSLSVLHELPVTGLKLDRSFLARGATVRPIAAAVAGLARSLGLDLTAEGVETEAQLALLAELGYPRAQGYLIGRPSPLAELVAAWGPSGG